MSPCTGRRRCDRQGRRVGGARRSRAKPSAGSGRFRFTALQERVLSAVGGGEVQSAVRFRAAKEAAPLAVRLHSQYQWKGHRLRTLRVLVHQWLWLT